MSTPVAGILRELESALSGTALSEIPGVLGALEETRARAFARLVTSPPPAPEDPLLTMSAVATRLSIKVSQARELGRRGELPTVTVGERFVRVRLSSLEGWIRTREAGGRA